MGTIYRASCPDCGYESEFYLGGGLLSINLKRSASVLPEEEKNILFTLINEDRIKDFNVENRITWCRECKKMESRTVIDVTEKNGTLQRFGGLCGVCRNKLTVYEGGAEEHIVCPQCGHGDLEFLEEGLWD